MAYEGIIVFTGYLKGNIEGIYRQLTRATYRYLQGTYEGNIQYLSGTYRVTESSHMILQVGIICMNMKSSQVINVILYFAKFNYIFIQCRNIYLWLLYL